MYRDLLIKSNRVLNREELCKRLTRRLWLIIVVSLLSGALEVNPLEHALDCSLLNSAAVVRQLARLRIQKGISNYHFLFELIALESVRLEGQILEVERERAKATRMQPLLELLQLLDEGAADFEIRTTTVKELQCLEHGPAVLLHEVGSEHHRRSTLAAHRVHEDRLVLLNRVFDEIENSFGSCVLLVEDNCALKVHPLER